MDAEKMMTYQEFWQWCEERSHDGCWGFLEALTCLDMLDKVRRTPIWKRKKEWEKRWRSIASEIVNQTNDKIRERMKTED